MVLLDNFEDLLDAAEPSRSPTPRWTRRCARCCRAPAHGVKVDHHHPRRARGSCCCIQPGVQRRLDLDEGLPSPYAEELLRAMDPDGKLGLRDRAGRAAGAGRASGPAASRGRWRRSRRSWPPTATPPCPSCSTQTARLPENVVEALVGEAFQPARPAGPAGHAGARDLSRCRCRRSRSTTCCSPTSRRSTAAPVLGRLVNMQFVRRDAGRYYLHQVDRDYALRRIPAGAARRPRRRPAAVHPQHALRDRGADYFDTDPHPARDVEDPRRPRPPAGRVRTALRRAATTTPPPQVLLEHRLRLPQAVGGTTGSRSSLHERLQGHITDPLIDAASKNGLGWVVYLVGGDVRRAIGLFEDALAVAREHDLRQAEAWSLTNLGSCYQELGETRRAIDFHERSLAIKRDFGDPADESLGLTNLGNCYHALGEIRRAIEFHERALEIDRSLGRRRDEAIDLGNLAIFYGRSGSQRGIELGEQALAIFRELGDRPNEAWALSGLGEIQRDLDALWTAIRLLDEAVAIADEVSRAQVPRRRQCRAGDDPPLRGRSRRSEGLRERRPCVRLRAGRGRSGVAVGCRPRA